MIVRDPPGFRSPAEILRERGKLGPYTTPSVVSVPADVDPAVVRAWAAEAGIKVAPRGRIPADVLAQFHEATSP